MSFLIQQAEYGKFASIPLSSLPAELAYPSDGTQPYAILVYSLNSGSTNVTVSAGDLEIGAVEIKDGTSDTRAVVDPVKGLKVDVAKSVSRKSSNGQSAGFAVLSAAGTLVTLFGSINTAAPTYIQLFDTAAFPVSGTAPLLSVFVAASGAFSIDYGESGLPLTNGLTVMSSQTYATLTSAVSANFIALATIWN